MIVQMPFDMFFIRRCLLILSILTILHMSAGRAQGADPGRPIIIPTYTGGMTVGTANGKVLRAAKASYTREGGIDSNDPAFFQAVADAGLNCVRLIFFDAWVKTHPTLPSPENPNPPPADVVDFDSQVEVNALINDFDTFVNNAADYGLYVIINYHDIGIEYDRQYASDFWAAIAQRYSLRTHVIYELVNEVDICTDSSIYRPVGSDSQGYQGYEVVDAIWDLYNQVRAVAADTHIMLFSFSCPNRSWAPVWTEFALVFYMSFHTGDPNVPTVDWTKASVSFHNYAGAPLSGGLFPPNENRLIDLMDQVPIFCGEVAFTDDQKDQGLLDPEKAIDYAGGGHALTASDEYAVVSMERLGIGWAHWNLGWEPVTLGGYQLSPFKWNYRLVLNALIRKGYFWTDTWLPPYDYVIQPKHTANNTVKTALCIPNNSNANNTNLTQANINFASPYQRFRITQVAPGSELFQVSCVGSGKTLRVSGGSTANGAPIVQHIYNNANSQRFAIKKVETNAYKILSGNTYRTSSPKGLDVPGSTTGTTPIQQYQYGGANNQKWIIECANVP